MLSNLGQFFSNTLFLGFIAGIPLYAACKKVSVYDEFILGAKDGLNVMLRILPHLVGMIVAIGMFRAAGGFTWFGNVFGPIFTWLGMPRDIVPLAFIRPFSGSASNGMLVELIQTHGPDSLLSRMAGTLMGSTETTFYVLAIYFGSIGIRRTRYAVPTGLIADLTGAVAAVWICRWFFS